MGGQEALQMPVSNSFLFLPCLTAGSVSSDQREVRVRESSNVISLDMVGSVSPVLWPLYGPEMLGLLTLSSGQMLQR